MTRPSLPPAPVARPPRRGRAASRRVLLGAAALALLAAGVAVPPRPAAACMWYPWDWFMPLPPCPVDDAEQRKKYLGGAGIAFAGKMPTYWRRFNAVKKEVQQWTRAYKEARKFMERVHFYAGEKGQLLPDPLPSLVAEFNRSKSRSKYLFDSVANKYNLLNPQAFLDSASARMRTEGGLLAAMAVDTVTLQVGTLRRDLNDQVQRDARKAGLDFDSVKVRADSLRAYSAHLDSLVAKRQDVAGGAEAAKAAFAARLNDYRALQLRSRTDIEELRRSAQASALTIQYQAARADGRRVGLGLGLGRKIPP